MTTHAGASRTAAIFAAFALLVACRPREQGALRKPAEEAGRRGRDTATVGNMFDENGMDSPAEDLVRIFSTVVVMRTNVEPVMTRDDEYIYTWYVLRTVRFVAKRPPLTV